MNERGTGDEATRDFADRIFNAVTVLYGAALNRCHTEMTQPEADLHDRVLRRAEQEMGPAVLAAVRWNLPPLAAPGSTAATPTDHGPA